MSEQPEAVEPATDTTPTPSTDTATPTATATSTGGAAVGLVPVAGVGASALSAGSAALFAAAGPLGLVAGGAAVVGGGALLARRRWRASRAGMGRASRLARSAVTTAKRSGGLTTGRPTGSAGQRGRRSRAVASGVVAGRRAATRSSGAGSGVAGGYSGRRGGASRPSGTGNRTGWAGGRTGGGRGGGSSAGRRRAGGPTGAGRGSAHGRPHGGIGPRATSGDRKRWAGRSTGPTGRTGSRWRRGGPGSGGLTGRERHAAKRAYRTVADRPRSLGERLRSRARYRLSRTRGGRMALRAGRGVALLGSGIGALAAGMWAISTRAWRWVAPYTARSGAYLTGAWSEFLLKGRRDREKSKYRSGFEPGKSGGRAVGGEVERRMSGASRQRIQYAAQLLAQEIAAYNEEGMLDYVEGIDAIPEALEYVAGGINALAVSALQEQPLDPRVGEFITGSAAGLGNVAGAMSQLRALIETVHEYDLRKLREHARPNDHKWDHARNNR